MGDQDVSIDTTCGSISELAMQLNKLQEATAKLLDAIKQGRNAARRDSMKKALEKLDSKVRIRFQPNKTRNASPNFSIS